MANISLNIQELHQFLESTPASHNIMLVGNHGIGKSQILTNYFKEKGMEVVALFLGQMADPGDLIGLPNKDEKTGKTDFMPPYWFPVDGKPIVLFLDELPEFSKVSMEAMRQPLEDGKITISRVSGSLTYPCEIMLVCAMNPCPCGYYTHPTKACVCNPGQVHRYLNRISGPLLDRIDIQIEIVPVPFEKMAEQKTGESSASIRERVIKARKIQEKRFANHPSIYCNAQMESKLLQQYATPDEQGLRLLRNAMNRLNLSARAYDRILKVARTIADLEGSEHIQSHHLAEAIGYRNLDRESWGG